jgi:hypothetical protein
MRNSARIAAIARFAVTRAAATALFDGVGGTSLTAALAGVAAGTRIATESGDLAVEELRVDDILATGQRVASVSHRTLDVDALARDADARPVRIGAGAIADGIPARTLLVAPAQLLLIDNAVVPAAALVNGASVARLRPDAPVTYVRLRLDTPACFVAEGIACDGFGVRASDSATIARIRGIIDARAALERGALDGDVATVDHRGAYGWALDTAHPSAPVTLEFVAGGAVLGEAPADVRRPDLEMAGLGEGRCGFLLRLRRPLPGNRPAFVTVRRAGDGAPMPRMPLLLPHPVGDPEEFAAALEHENAAAAEDEPVRETLANFLAHQVDRLLQARGERPSPPPAPDC